MKILLLSAYHAQSHKQWCEGLISSFPEHSWELLSLPPRYFSWHMRGNALIWSKFHQKTLGKDFDMVIATSMTDLHGLRGFLPGFADIPSMLYFHENQFEYPANALQKAQIELQLVSLYSALCADQIVFNSLYNLQSFIAGVQQLLKKLPDFVPSGQIEAIQRKSSVLPVPLCNQCYCTEKTTSKKFSIVWNHRWEYDKWPENFFLALLKLKQMDVDYEVHVLGQQFRQQPAVFTEMKQVLKDNIQTWGYIEKDEEYREVLRSANVVVSTALHDFQGLAVLEAVAGGCLPVVPDRLAYPQFFQDKYRYPSHIEDNEKQAEVLASHLAGLAIDYGKQELPEVPDLYDLSWQAMKPKYTSLMNAYGKECVNFS